MKPHFFDIFTRPLRSKKIIPVFIPFYGCKVRCVFCAQEIQTGQKQIPIKKVLEQVTKILTQTDSAKQPVELAFYGGTFTALNQDDFDTCIHFAEFWKKQVGLSGMRCSTRPDCLDSVRLMALKDAGFTTIELGIQSFDTNALNISKRNYSEEVATRACLQVRDVGFELGVQLLPGMPGVDMNVALADVRKALATNCNFLRLYPCLVFQGTALAQDWESGKYIPWDQDTTIRFLALAQKLAWAKNTPIARMGLAQEPGLQEKILAGPVHHSLGNVARSLALAMRLEEEICMQAGRQPVLENTLRQTTLEEALERFKKPPTHVSNIKFSLDVPSAWQGDFWGHAGALRVFYKYYGFTPEQINFKMDTEKFCLYQG